MALSVILCGILVSTSGPAVTAFASVLGEGQTTEQTSDATDTGESADVTVGNDTNQADEQQPAAEGDAAEDEAAATDDAAAEAQPEDDWQQNAVAESGAVSAPMARSVNEGDISGVTVNLFDYQDSYNNGENLSNASDINYYQRSADWWGSRYSSRTFKFGEGSIDRNNNLLGRLNSWSGYYTTTDTQMDYDANILRGIMSSTLSGGDPANLTLSNTYANATGAGASLGYLFPTTSGGGVNQVARNVKATGFFSKDSDGYISYDSAKNFATYNASSNSLVSESGPTSFKAQFMPFNTMGNVEQSPDYNFGMTIQANFLYPKDGQVNGEDMIFSFTGDDDVWVYVDGKLALDLGGIHGKNGGTIDFASQRVYYNDEGYNEQNGAHKEGGRSYDTFEELGLDMGNDWSQHSLTFIYFERGAGASNCSIKFNMPTIPEGSAQIQKVVDYSNVNDVSDVDFHFNAYVNYEGTNSDKDYKLFEGEYDVTENGKVIETRTAEDGVITLKDGQIATLKSGDYGTIKQTSKYYVVETGATSDKYTVTIDGTTVSDYKDENDKVTGQQSGKVTVGDMARMVFHNSISADNAFNLKVEKAGTGLPADATYNVLVKVGEKAYTGKYTVYDENGKVEGMMDLTSSDGVITLKAGQYALIQGLVGGNTVTAQEVDRGGSPFTGDETYNAPAYSVDGSNDAVIVGDKITNGCAGATAAEGNALGSNPQINLKVTNSTKTGSLIISKRVTGSASNLGKHYEFELTNVALASKEFDVTIADADGEGANEDHGLTTDGKLAFSETGVATLKLKHDETATVTGLPNGATFTLVETGLGNNTATTTVTMNEMEQTINGGSTGGYVTDAIVSGTAVNVSVVNNFELTPGTGVTTNVTPMLGLLVVAGAGAAALVYAYYRRLGKTGHGNWKE